MKKTALFVIAVLVCALSVFALSAYTFGGNGEVKAEGKADSIELLYDFLDVFDEDADLVVTYKSGDEVQFVASVKGTTANVIAKDGTILYAFIKDGEYYYALESEDYRYYEADKELYDAYYRYFLNEIAVIDLLPEDGGTFTCSTATKEKETDGVTESTATLKFKFDSEYGEIEINASEVNGKLQEIVLEIKDKSEPENDRNFTYTFEYGNAEVTVPDVDAWEIFDNNATAIYTRDEFFFSTLYAGNVIVTVEDGEGVLVETIADGVDLTVYPAGNKTYSFMTEEGEFIYAMEDEVSHYYFTGEDWYEIGCNAYYKTFISIFDEIAAVGLKFNCEVEEDEESGNGTMIFTIGYGGEVVFTLTATKTEGFVTEATITTAETETTISFVYDEAEVSAPDITDWPHEESEATIDADGIYEE
ncbi:MAG: hypothetical protein J6126_02285 [Clostridia bacterium]|nr:hypothetical protein [Clostridia bacterium]